MRACDKCVLLARARAHSQSFAVDLNLALDTGGGGGERDALVLDEVRLRVLRCVALA